MNISKENKKLSTVTIQLDAPFCRSSKNQDQPRAVRVLRPDMSQFKGSLRELASDLEEVHFGITES